MARTGGGSYKVMLVIATNQPELLDSALVDRMGNLHLFMNFVLKC